MLECSSCDMMGALLEAVDRVDCEVAAEERQGDVTKVVRHPGTGSYGLLVGREVLEDHPDYFWGENAPPWCRARISNERLE